MKDHKQHERGDIDCDGYADVLLGTRQVALVASEKGGCLTELSIKRCSVNILDILTRRPEAYHAKLAQASDAGPDSTKTIHDQLSVKEAGLSEYLVYDAVRRASLLDHFFSPDTTLDDMAASQYEELGDFVFSDYAMASSHKKGDVSISLSRQGVVQQSRVDLKKRIELSGPEKLSMHYDLKGMFSGLFAVGMNISLLGSPYALVHVGDKTMQMRSKAAHEDIREFSIEDKFLDLTLRFVFSEDIRLWHYPVETISLSEQGVERLYQGTAFLFVVPLQGPEKKKMHFTVDFGEEHI
jgi:alpha-amylase